MPASALPPKQAPSYLWWLVLGLVGLDYFSTLAYLPSMAVEAAGAAAPLAALAVVVVTLLGALPVYLYVVGRSPHGAGATGLLERVLHGWQGKIVVLALLGFVATDFIITRSLSLADATVHLVHNPYWREHAAWLTDNKETVRGWFPEFLRGRFFDFWNEQLVMTVVLSSVVFAFWALLRLGFTPTFLRLAALLVGLYMLANAAIIVSGLVFILDHPNLSSGVLEPLRGGFSSPGGGRAEQLLLVLGTAFFYFPRMALGLSGFELTMASAPQVRGEMGDDPAQPRGRIRNTRKLMVTAALVMSVFLVGSVFVVTHLVPENTLHVPAGRDSPADATGRALSYLAHGQPVRGQPASDPDDTLGPLFGPVFGTVYDLLTILMLCLAGVSVTIGLRDLLPHYLARYGMQLAWAQRIGMITHLFNLAILMVTVVYRASVEAQQWAYATSVLVLLTAAAWAALLDVRLRTRGSYLAWPFSLPFGLIWLFFLAMTILTLCINASGLAIALLLVFITLSTAFASRWLRSMELRFEGFEFRDNYSRRRWEEIRQFEFQVLVPHRHEHMTLVEKDREVRRKHRLGSEVPIIFIEATIGDPSEFSETPLMQIESEKGLEVIRVSKCNSIAHVLAAIGLEFRHVGRPPEIYFDWSEEPPLAANLNFLFMGQGNIPWMVHALIRKAEPNTERRPRVVIG
jgi:hypothetical protein